MSKFFSYVRSKTFLNNVIIAIVSIVIFLAILFYSLNIYTRHGEGLPVPKLKGMLIEEAIQILESKGLRYQVDSVYLNDKQPGEVVEQDPDANTNVKQERTIYLTIITRQAPNVKFPDIDGKTFLEARAILNNYGLKLGDTSYVSDVARDVVLSINFGGSSMTTDQMVPKGSKISLVLGDGLGASEVDLPNLLGLNLNEARLSLLGSSLNLGSITYDGILTDTLNAVIIKQFPSLSDSTSKVKIGTHVDLVLSDHN